MKGKNYNLELVRMIAFIMVIAIHVSNYFCRAYGEIPTGEYVYSLFWNTVSRVSVPCFFMITGALLLGRTEPLGKHVKRVLRFLFVLAVWSLIYVLWNRFYMQTPYDLNKILYVPAEAHLWYLYAMLPIYCVLPFFQVMCRGMNLKLERAFLAVITAAVIVNYVTSLQHGEVYYDLPIVGDRVYSFYVFIGYYLYKYRNHIRFGQRVAGLCCLVSLTAVFGVTWAVTAGSGVHYEKILEYGDPLLVLASASFFLFLIRLKKGALCPGEKGRKVVDLVCECSFGIYLIHILFLDHYKKYMEAEAVSAWIAVPGLVVLIGCISFFCVWLLRRTTFGRRIT